MKVKPVGYRVLIQPDKVEEVTETGIVIAREAVKNEQLGQVAGKVLAIGEDCWAEHKKPWCKVGDRILYQRYAGMRVPDGKGGFRDDLVLLNDTDISGVIVSEGEDNG